MEKAETNNLGDTSCRRFVPLLDRVCAGHPETDLAPRLRGRGGDMLRWHSSEIPSGGY
jgi:hypothetical protein